MAAAMMKRVLPKVPNARSSSCLKAKQFFQNTPNQLGCVIWLHTTEHNADKYAKRMFQKTDKNLERLLGYERRHKRKTWHENSNAPVGEWQKSMKGPTPGSQRRAKMLSAVLYEYITSMINTGDIDERLTEMGIEIVKVRMAADFSQINIYWLATGDEKDEELDKILLDVAHKVRHQLVTFHIMGKLPPVQFVKDVSVARLQQVEFLLRQADFGEDFTPTSLGHDMKALPVIKVASQRRRLQLTLQKTAEKFRQMDLEAAQENMENSAEDNTLFAKEHGMEYHDNVTEIGEDALGSSGIEVELRDDVYGINHGELMKKLILAKSKKSTQKERDLNIDLSASYQRSSQDKTAYEKLIKKRLSKDWVVRHGRERHRVLAEALYEDNE